MRREADLDASDFAAFLDGDGGGAAWLRSAALREEARALGGYLIRARSDTGELERAVLRADDGSRRGGGVLGGGDERHAGFAEWLAGCAVDDAAGDEGGLGLGAQREREGEERDGVTESHNY